MKNRRRSPTVRDPLPRQFLLLGSFLLWAWASQADPTILSSVPANGATGVSPATTIRLSFSEAMDITATTVMVMDANTYQFLPTTDAWTSGNTILTCTPTAALVGNHIIVWSVDGLSAGGIALTGDTGGMFTVGTGATGCDTNASMLSLTVAKGWTYTQSSSAAPSFNTNNPYCFVPCISLPCPRDATNVSLQLPGSSTWNTMMLVYPGHLTLTDCSYMNQPSFDTAYPAGGYTFRIQSVTSNQTVTVNLPSASAQPQPPAPHVSNYAAGQAIDPAQPFVLSWDLMAGGTPADCIYVEIYGGVFHTPGLGMPGALNGTATSVAIPAGTFQSNQSYPGCITFYHYQFLTNGTSYLALTYRASTTEFTLHTVGGASVLVLSNCGWSEGRAFGFDVTCTNGQALVAEYATNLALLQWWRLYSTNSPGQSVRFTDPAAATNRETIYRVRTGP